MKNDALRKGLFITGTDTGVGKTYIGAQLVSALYEMDVPVVPRKPIESGCEFQGGELLPEDAKQYYEAAKKKFSLAEICPFRFEPAISPQRAAQLINKPVSINNAQQSCLKNVNENNFLFVEGAGGFYSPLCEDGKNSDLAKSLNLPILLVAKNQLGCINHILLTAEAIRNHGLYLSTVVLNEQEECTDKNMNNYEDLLNYLDVPIYPVSFGDTINSELIYTILETK